MNRKTHPALEHYLHLCHLALWAAALDLAEYRVWNSWQRKGLHLRWGMHHRIYDLLDCVGFCYDEKRPFTTLADSQQQQTNLFNFMQAVNQSIEAADYPLEDDQNQNDAYVG